MSTKRDEWTDAITLAAGAVPLSDLLAIVAEATRELCAEFPQHNCHNGATNNWEIGKKVVAHVKANYE